MVRLNLRHLRENMTGERSASTAFQRIQLEFENMKTLRTPPARLCASRRQGW